MKKNAWRIALALAFSAAGLYFALRGVDWTQVGRHLQQARWEWIGLALVALIVELLCRAARWRVLLKRRLSLGDALGLIGIGYMVSNLIPLRAGDPTRAVAANLRRGIPIMLALSTVVVERTLDLLTVALLLLGTLPFVASADPQQSWQLTGWITGGISLGALVGLILLARYPQPAEALARWGLARLRLRNPEPWLKPLHQIIEGLQTLRSPGEGITLAFWSVVIWIFTIAYYQAALYAFVPAPPWLAGPVLTWATALGMIAPAPGGVGTMHFAMNSTLTLIFHIPTEAATAYSLIAHALQYLVGIGMGAVVLLLWGISPRQIRVTED